MNISVVVKPNYTTIDYTLLNYQIWLSIKYKRDNERWYHKTRIDILYSTIWTKENDADNQIESAIKILSDKEMMKKVCTNQIVKDIQENNIYNNRISKQDKILKLLLENKTTFTFDYNEESINS
jgi:hypothetical protein